MLLVSFTKLLHIGFSFVQVCPSNHISDISADDQNGIGVQQISLINKDMQNDSMRKTITGICVKIRPHHEVSF